MSREFLLEKLKFAFKGFDRNDNKFLSEEDFVLAGQRLVTAFGMSPRSPEAERVREAWKGMWTGLVQPMDRDGDGRVTPDEFALSFAGGADDPGGYPAWVTPAVEMFLDVADRDHDGTLSRAEYVTAYKAMYGLTDDALRLAFDHLDADSDGHLTRDELREAIREYWVGEDENARGNWLLGPLPE